MIAPVCVLLRLEPCAHIQSKIDDRQNTLSYHQKTHSSRKERDIGKYYLALIPYGYSLINIANKGKPLWSPFSEFN
ncbi:hypothetical protein SYGE1_30 [Escherichia phage vB_EcoP_SYGE1]|uniref:Uncharacterized protein n=1 Tax=Escherichia phage vB_EcoP_SYGE1 TaxID=2829847 RepID=A0A8T8IW32_9CAUD|nr:hypothetical protein SYGE1_30 [Escherichia phage vB_EcoP_SYGE1]